ncbi:hypothetical protein LOTGIDRAFT_155460 [Lottia gigantea]|uniref:Uncharacterized protein n=1 Tax=Lottia gigantea TaxID=225164 RepID=V3ZNS9_LOTGI|nr:hypothetical protein LOTGIDRAFT_155460 [Lottia gigantea]ESO84135.1 hypothetical protein LOTGIDRAFT_155460 [Lottia gigantea]
MSTEVKTKRTVQPKYITSDFQMRPLGCLRNKRDLDSEDVEDVDGKIVYNGDQDETRPPNKKIIQLPMLKLNLESLTGSSNNEDNIALESTRKTLRTLIDDCKRELQTTEIKNYEFISPVNNSQNNNPGEVKSYNKHSVEKVRLRNRLPPLKRKDSEGKQRKPLAKTPDAICSVAFTNQISDTVGQEYLDYLDDISPRDADQGDDLPVAIIPETNSPTELYPEMASWNSYTDITPTRKGSYKGCSKHEYLLKKHRFQRELMEERIRARQDVNLSWVNINHSGYKASPIYRYTTYQQKPVTELSPQPQQPPPSNDHCPMCTMYRSERIPTACPPNSPRCHIGVLGQHEETIQEIEDEYTARSIDHFNDGNTMEPMSTYKLAQKQGFRGSKPPITFKMAFCK